MFIGGMGAGTNLLIDYPLKQGLKPCRYCATGYPPSASY